ncbi:MAG: glycosyltransferase family 39 protein [Patescibacteria group bacterium]
MRRLLILALVIGSLTRLLWLTRYPVGFTPDEAAFGYNAYSLLLTGRDEWGVPWWQLFFTNLRSFGDYKLPLYTFLAIPSVKIFGLTEFAVRLPNAVFGILAIGAVYLLANKLFPRSGSIAALLLAISPWHVQLSRGAFEANLATFLLPMGIYLFLENKTLFSTLFFTAAAYSYHSARLILPFILVFIFVNFRNKFKPLLLIPLIVSLWGLSSARVADVSIFSPTDNWLGVATRRFEARALGLPDQIARVFSNKLVYSLSTFSQNYISYFSPNFLFTSGAGEPFYGMMPGRGVLYLIELPILVLALLYFIRKPSRSVFLLLILIALAPIPAALAKGPGAAANRAVIMLPWLIILLSTAIVRLPRQWLTLVIGAYITSFVFFGEDYLYHSPYLAAPSMSYGWRDLMPRLQAFTDRFPDVRFSRSLSEPHIFVAFYTRFDPREYQKASASWPRNVKFLDQFDGYYLGKYRFGVIHPADPVTIPTLYIGKPEDFSPDFPEYFHINYPSSRPAIIVAQKLP